MCYTYETRGLMGGPYTVMERNGPVNYKIANPDKPRHFKLVHINSLKLYHNRAYSVNQAVVVADSELWMSASS